MNQTQAFHQRIDQALAFNWKLLFPISLVNLMLAAWWVISRGAA